MMKSFDIWRVLWATSRELRASKSWKFATRFSRLVAQNSKLDRVHT
jgi:hypothetical protein